MTLTEGSTVLNSHIDSFFINLRPQNKTVRLTDIATVREWDSIADVTSFYHISMFKRQPIRINPDRIMLIVETIYIQGPAGDEEQKVKIRRKGEIEKKTEKSKNGKLPNRVDLIKRSIKRHRKWIRPDWLAGCRARMLLWLVSWKCDSPAYWSTITNTHRLCKSSMRHRCRRKLEIMELFYRYNKWDSLSNQWNRFPQKHLCKQ